MTLLRDQGRKLLRVERGTMTTFAWSRLRAYRPRSPHRESGRRKRRRVATLAALAGDASGFAKQKHDRAQRLALRVKPLKETTH